MFKYEKIFQAVVHTKFYFSRVNIACWNFNFTVNINLKENVYPLKQKNLTLVHHFVVIEQSNLDKQY